MSNLDAQQVIHLKTKQGRDTHEKCFDRQIIMSFLQVS